MFQTSSPSRRFNSRTTSVDDIWVYWSCNQRAETSRIRDVSLGGLFIETSRPSPVDSKAQVDFLVQEGQIRAEAVVRHIQPSRGVGLKFVALRDTDRPNLIALLSRLRSLQA